MATRQAQATTLHPFLSGSNDTNPIVGVFQSPAILGDVEWYPSNGNMASDGAAAQSAPGWGGSRLDLDDVMFFNKNDSVGAMASAQDGGGSTEIIGSDGGGGGEQQVQYTPYELKWTPDVTFRVTTIIVVMALTVIGNTSLIAIITCHEKLRRKRVNIFLVNLAVGDLMVCFVTMTTEILFVAFGEWVLGPMACKLIVYGQIVTLASATFLLTGMSIDRYQVIVQPLKSLTGQPKIWRKVLVAWLCALVFATPQLFIFVQVEAGFHPDGRAKHMCKSQGYTAPWQRKLYFTFLATYILLIPTVIMSFCYINIIRVVWMRSDSDRARAQPRLRFVSSMARSRDQHGVSVALPAGGVPSLPAGGRRSTLGVCAVDSDIPVNTLNIPKKLISSSKRNVIKMTLSVIVGFVLCWTPYYVVGLIRIYSDYEIKLEQALSVSEIMALAHSALNPILYGIFSTKVARKVCRQLCWRCRKDPHRGLSPDSGYLEEETTFTWAESSRINRISIVVPVASSRSDGGSLWSGLWNRFKSLCRCGGSESQEYAASQTSKRPLLIYRKLFPKGRLAHASNNNPVQNKYNSFCLHATGKEQVTAERELDKKTGSGDLSTSDPVHSYELQNISTYGDPMVVQYQANRAKAADRLTSPPVDVRDPDKEDQPQDGAESGSQSDVSFAHTYSASESESETPTEPNLPQVKT